MVKKQDTRTDESSYNAEYPYNQVIETPAGHQIQIDNTPGHERIFIQHSSGTYQEISADGKVINFAVGDVKNYNKAGMTMTIDENGDFKMTGHTRMLVGGGLHAEIAGDTGIMTQALALALMGALNLRATNIYMASDGSMNINVAGGINIKAGGDIRINGATINLNS